MEDIRTATVALKALVELGYPLELSSLIDYLAKSPDSRDELVKFDNEDTLSIFLKKFPSMFWVDGCKVFPAQMKPKGVSRCSNQMPLPQSHSAVQPATHEREVDRKQENVDTETLQKQAALHFMEVLRAKGPLPLTRIHGYIGSCPVQVRQAIPTGPVKIRELFLKYSSNFTIDANDVVHLQPSPITEVSNDNVSITPLVTTSSSREENCDRAEAGTSSDGVGLNGSTEPSTSSSKEDSDVKRTQDMETHVKEEAAHIVDALENKVSMPLGGVHGSTEPSISSSEEDIDVKRTQDMEALLEEGAVYIVDILENKVSMPLCRIHGHVNQCREEVRKAIGGGPEKARTLFLKFPAYFYIDDHDDVHLTSKLTQECIKAVLASLEKNGPLQLGELGSPEVFSIGDDGMVHLTSATISQSQGKKSGTDNRSYAMVVETGQKIHLEDKKAKKEGILLEGVQHFKQALESKGSMPLKNIFGHVNQCRNEVKWAVGCSMDNVETFLLKYPGVFYIDKNLMVHLVCNRAQGQQQKQHKTNIKQLPIEEKALAHFKGILSRKGPSTIHVLSSCFSSCGQDIRRHVGSSKEGLTKFFRKHPQVFKVDANKVVYLHASSTVFKPQRWASCDTLAVPRDTAFPRVLSKLSGSTPDVRSAVDGGTLQQAEEVQDKPNQLTEKGCKDKNEIERGWGLTAPSYRIIFLLEISYWWTQNMANLGSQPQLFQVQDECVTLVAGEGEFEEGTSQCLATPRARCTIGEVSVISKNTAHLCLPDDKEAILDLTDAHNSITTSRLIVGDCLVAYIVPSNQSEIPWEVSEVKNVMGKAVPAQIRAKTATATCGSDRLKEAPQQSFLEEEQQHMEDQTDQENNQQEPEEKLDQAEIEKETLELIVNLVQKSGQVSVRSLQGHINLLGEEKQDCIKDKGGLLTFLQNHYGTIFKIDSTSESVSLRQKQDEQEAELDFLTSSYSAEGEQVQATRLTVEEEVETVGSSLEIPSPLEKTSIYVDISDAEDSKKNQNVPMKEAGDDIATSVLKTRHNTEDCDDMDISTVVTPSVFVAQETDIVHTPNALLEQYLNEKETVCDSLGLPTATVHPVVPVDNPPGQPDDDFTSLLHMFKDNLSPIQDNLVEVEMDIGRIPIARYYNPASPNLLAPLRLSEETLTRETLETILSALPLDRSAIGQGRVLLRGSLHWVSTLKNSSDDIVGLTLRRGQAVPGCLDLLWDMVTSGTSTLIIGRPCSGKTTLLREWARVLSDVCYRRVIVVDTLNEIAGGDDVPHPGVGGARRVQVHNRCQQVSQLQTAARNHSPDCIIVDEVQTQEEVTALQAIRLTGIQVIAGVCAGSLPDLLHNSVMRGLLGMSDPTSSASAQHSANRQTPTFPHSLPVFQAAVQIHNRDNLSVYSDVASFVRMSLLEGRFPLAQQRKRVVTSGRKTEL
ncbi:hypothetical protein Bbelb_144840 [Branchiostoma belcheri]|nr:hypothetical protein Bbelb_144840 [Branchiostoma belcheri]